eukprot:2271556-Alexandrium_andersonii.AAC.1
MGSDVVPEPLEGPFCAAVRADRECGKESLPRALQSALFTRCHAANGFDDGCVGSEGLWADKK